MPQTVQPGLGTDRSEVMNSLDQLPKNDSGTFLTDRVERRLLAWPARGWQDISHRILIAFAAD
ncbi:MAG: hypothetical protein ACRDYB_06020 [Acidimicrobiales bacterium]